MYRFTEQGATGRMRIVKADFADRRVTDLLRHHLETARAATAPGSAHALDIGALQAPDIDAWTVCRIGSQPSLA